MRQGPIRDSARLAAIVILTAGTLQAQGGKAPPEKAPDARAPERSEQQARTEFLEAYQGRRWAEVERIHEQVFARSFPALLRDQGHELRYARALTELGKLPGAAEALNRLIRGHMENIEALVLLAEIRIQSTRGEDIEEAKDLIISASRLGFPALRDLTEGRRGVLFAALMHDPRFILKLFRHSGRAESSAVRDIFRPAYELAMAEAEAARAVAGKAQRRALLEAEGVRLEAEIEALLEAQAAPERILARFDAFDATARQLRDEFGLVRERGVGPGWGRSDWPDVRVALRLQALVQEGNQLLRAMERALDQEDTDVALEGHGKVSALVAELRREDREAFTRSADGLRQRAGVLRGKAAELQVIKRLELTVTGIILDRTPPSADRLCGHRAIINNKVYKELDAVTDAFDEPIIGLSVAAILEGAVRFRYEQRFFLRPLEVRLR